MLDAIFFIDMIINFNSAYFNEQGQLITNRTKVTLRYLKSWFIIDLFSCFPFSLFETENSSKSAFEEYNHFNELVKLPRLFRFLRLVRLFKLFQEHTTNEMVEKIQDYFVIRSSVMKILASSISVIFCVHIMACFWYYSSKFEGYSPETWVFRSGINLDDNLSLYLMSLY